MLYLRLLSPVGVKNRRSRRVGEVFSYTINAEAAPRYRKTEILYWYIPVIPI